MCSPQRVAARYLQSDLIPPLGFPGGPCYVVQRIMEEVHNPKLRDDLVADVEHGLKIDNQEAGQIYHLDAEAGVGAFKKMLLVPHTQYRMDQRGITVTEIRMALASFQKARNDERSRHSYMAKKWEYDMMRGEPINWTDPKVKLTVVFLAGRDMVRVITCYWEGESDPKPTQGGCPVP